MGKRSVSIDETRIAFWIRKCISFCLFCFEMWINHCSIPFRNFSICWIEWEFLNWACKSHALQFTTTKLCKVLIKILVNANISKDATIFIWFKLATFSEITKIASRIWHTKRTMSDWHHNWSKSKQKALNTFVTNNIKIRRRRWYVIFFNKNSFELPIFHSVFRFLW